MLKVVAHIVCTGIKLVKRKFDKYILTFVPCVLILSQFFYSPTDAQVNCSKNNIKIYIKTAPTCFGAVTPSSASALLVLAKVTVVKIANYGTSVCGDVAAATSPHTDVP